MFENKKILITGGTGLIGSRLAERLFIEEKAIVRVMVHNWPKATWVSRLDVELIQGDITNSKDVENAVQGCEIVFHCVGVGGSKSTAMKINAEGTKNVLNACKKQDVKRVVYLSSIVVHGEKIYDGLNESSPFISYNDAYADSKIEAEKIFWQKTSEYGLDASLIRPTYVWGPISQYYTIDFVDQMKLNKFHLVDNGNHDCNAVYVDNVVDLCLICASNPNAIGEAFIAADSEKIKWIDFFTYFAKMLNKNVKEFKNIPSKDTSKRKILKFAKEIILKNINAFTKLNEKIEPKNETLAKWFCKAPRKFLKIQLKGIQNILPEMDSTEMNFYCNDGRVDISKSERLLDYHPRISILEGMTQTELWLKDQNYL
jgi:nucleoside-diphosphate-sugar epimerase